MGKQIRFFMVHSDELAFHEIVEGIGDFFIDKKGDQIISDTFDATGGKALYLKNVESEVAIAKGFLDVAESDVIEFYRSSAHGNDLFYGRLWAEFTYYGHSGERLTKEKWFNDWFESYRRRIKKEFRISKCKDFYIAEEAYRMYLRGECRMMAASRLCVEFRSNVRGGF